MRTSEHGAREGRKGTALVAITAIVASLSIVSMTILTKNTATMKAQRFIREDASARYVAEAALATAVVDLQTGGEGNFGSAGQPVEYGRASYWVAATDLGGGMTSLVATGVDGAGGTRLQLVVGEVNDSVWAWGAFGDESMRMASNARVDSYDSSAGSYESQAVHGSGSSTFASSNGNVGSNGNVALQQNAKVYGNAIPGPGGSTTVAGNAVVTGSTAPNSTEVVMPELVIPVIPLTGDLNVPNNGVHNLASGSHHFGESSVGTGATLNITGPATVVFDSFEVLSNAEVLVDGSAGPVEIYVEGDFIMNSNTLVAPLSRVPSELALLLATDNIVDPGMEVELDELGLESNAQFYGSLYAPNAEVLVDSNFELFGAIVARRLRLDSNSQVHFDEALMDARGGGAGGALERLCWREMPFSMQSGSSY